VKLSSNQWDLNNYLFSEVPSPTSRSIPETRRDKVIDLYMMTVMIM
jgi:hypothetical protein